MERNESMENFTGSADIILSPEEQVELGDLMDVVYWTNLAAAVFSIAAILSDFVAYLIGDGLQGDYSAKTCIKAQAVSDILQCLFLMQMGFNFTDVEFLRPLWHAISINDFSCRMHKWYFNFTPQLAALLTALISVDRVAAINAPIFYREHGTTTNAWKYLVAPAILFSVLTSLPHYFFNALQTNCFLSGEYSWEMNVIETINYLYLGLVPLIVVCNACMIYGLCSRKGGETGSTKAVTIALMVLCFFYCVSVISYRICTTEANAQDFSNPLSAMKAELWWAAGNLIIAVNSTLTAPIYLTMGTMRAALIVKVKHLAGCLGGK